MYEAAVELTRASSPDGPTIGLQKVAAKFNIAIVVVNNMKTGKRELHNTTDGQRDFAPAKPEPCFGEDLFQVVTSRVMLERD